MPAYFDGEQLLGSVHLIWTRYRKFKCDIYFCGLNYTLSEPLLLFLLFILRVKVF